FMRRRSPVRQTAYWQRRPLRKARSFAPGLSLSMIAPQDARFAHRDGGASSSPPSAYGGYRACAWRLTPCFAGAPWAAAGNVPRPGVRGAEEMAFLRADLVQLLQRVHPLGDGGQPVLATPLATPPAVAMGELFARTASSAEAQAGAAPVAKSCLEMHRSSPRRLDRSAAVVPA